MVCFWHGSVFSFVCWHVLVPFVCWHMYAHMFSFWVCVCVLVYTYVYVLCLSVNLKCACMFYLFLVSLSLCLFWYVVCVNLKCVLKKVLKFCVSYIMCLCVSRVLAQSSRFFQSIRRGNITQKPHTYTVFILIQPPIFVMT